MKNMTTRKMTTIAMIAGLYTAITFVIAPISFGSAQYRLSEALTILPVFGQIPIVGVTLGCFLSNLVGMMMGTNILGAIDVFVGTFASFVAAILSYKLRGFKIKGLPILAAIPPILVNAVVIGLELTYLITGGIQTEVFIAQFLSVFIGQTVSLVIGLVLFKVITSSNNGIVNSLSDK